MNTPISGDSLRQRIYEQQLLVNHLRRQAFQEEEIGPFQEQLETAEAALAELEAQLAELTGQDASSGQLLDTTKTKPKVLGAETTGLEAQVYLRMEHISTATYHLFQVSQTPLLSVQVKNIPAEKPGASTKEKAPIRRVRVSAYIDGYSVPAVKTFELVPRQAYNFDLLPALVPERVRQINELTRASLNVLVDDLDTGKVEIHESYPVWLLARTTAPLAVRDPKTGYYQDLTAYLGAFVTPNAPAIMKFLRLAADMHPSKTLAGYQGSEEQVEPQVKALYDALKTSAGITYVNSVIDFTPDLGQANQRVRLPRESLEDHQANCIDGTVLFASLLEAISMSPAIVLIPGHAFLAYETWSGAPDEWRYLETTMIGSRPFEEARAYADKNARKWMEQRKLKNNPAAFRLLPLRDLRSRLRIYPME